FKLTKKKSGFGASDHDAFSMVKIPVLFMFTDYHDQYHQPTDTADRINVAGMKRIADWTEDMVNRLAAAAKRPEYVEQKSLPSGGGRDGPRIGIRPSYGDDEPGVLIEGVSSGGPAERGGLKPGDRIVFLDGKPVKDLTTYMTLMAATKKGDTVQLTLH